MRSLVWFIIGFIVGFWLYGAVERFDQPRPPREITVYDTLYLHDTTVIERPTLKYLTNLRIDTVKMMSVEHDTVTVEIPIEQKVYEGSNYTAWVSGFRPALDSLTIINDREIITQRIEITKPAKHWGLGVSAGYAATPKGLQPYIGIGITYNIFAF